MLWSKYPDYKRLQISSILTGLGSWISFIGMLVLLKEITFNGIQLGLLWAVSGLAPIFFSVFTGVFVDKVNLRKLIYMMDIFICIFLLLYIVVPSLKMHIAWFAFFIIRFFIGIANSFVSVASQKVVKNIVKEEDLILANSISYTITSIIRLIGASIGGIVVAFLPLNYVWIIAAIFSLISSINIYLSSWKQESSLKTSKNFKKEFLLGIQVVRNNRLVFLVLFSGLTLGIIIGTFNLMLQEYVTNIYIMENYGLSLLYFAEGTTAVIMGLFIANKNILLENKNNYSYFYIMLGLSWFLFSFTENIYQGMFFLITFAISTAILAPYEKYIMQTQVAYDFQGRVFGLWNTVSMVSIQIGALLTGIIIEIFGIRFVPLLTGIFQIIMGLIFCILVYSRNMKK